MAWSRDPSWLSARRPGVCAGRECNDPIRPGDRIFYYPIGRLAFVGPCADAAAADFHMMVAAEGG